MDAVVGYEGSHNVLLILHFVNSSLLAAFPLIFTDGGCAFAHPDVLECGLDRLIRTSIYYCDR